MPSFNGEMIGLYVWASGLILITALLVKYGTEKMSLNGETGRKLLHIVAILTCGYVVRQSEQTNLLAIIFFVFFIILLFVAHYELLLANERRSYGIALFPLAFSILLLTPLEKDAILFGIVTLGISDALAGWAGQKLNVKKHTFLYEDKSWSGFFVFYISTVFISLVFIGITPAILILALIPALSELFSYRGSDNLTIPLIAAFWYQTLQRTEILTIHWYIIFILVIALVLAGKKKWLNSSGMAAALLLGVIIIFSGNIFFLIPIGVFFIAGSITSSLHKGQKDAAGRNAFQVFANGWVAVTCIWIYEATKNEIFLIGYLISIAISFADTMSSDIGLYFKHKTYDILTFRSMKPGLSGGVSYSGTLAGFTASILFSVLCCFLFDLNTDQCILIAASGVIGMTTDSILGSVWQAKYLEEGQLTEDKGSNVKLVKGVKWLDNDGVNFICNLLVTIVFLAVGYIFF